MFKIFPKFDNSRYWLSLLTNLSNPDNHLTIPNNHKYTRHCLWKLRASEKYNSCSETQQIRLNIYSDRCIDKKLQHKGAMQFDVISHDPVKWQVIKVFNRGDDSFLPVCSVSCTVHLQLFTNNVLTLKVTIVK